MDFNEKETNVKKSVTRMHPEKRRTVVADSDKLILQESHFYNFHLLSSYFLEQVLDRIRHAYCTPLEFGHDVSFFRICTVSGTTCYLFFDRVPDIILCCLCTLRTSFIVLHQLSLRCLSLMTLQF